MSRYRRALIPGGVVFFAVTFVDRRSTALVEQMDRLREPAVRKQPEAGLLTQALQYQLGTCPRKEFLARQFATPMSRSYSCLELRPLITCAPAPRP